MKTVLLLIGFMIAPSHLAEAQQPTKMFRIGYLAAFDSTFESTRAEAIRLALRELGYVEGQNIAIAYRYADGKKDRRPELLADLVRRKVDIIVVAGGAGLVRAAKNVTATIPIVMVRGGANPVEARVITSLVRPGGNVTGVTLISGELSGKRLELFKEAIPKLARVAVLYNPDTASSVIEVKEHLPVTARALGVTLKFWEILNPDGLEKTFAALGGERPDGVYVTGSPLIYANGKRIVGLALKSRLASIYQNREAVERGGLISYGADLADSYRRLVMWTRS